MMKKSSFRNNDEKNHFKRMIMKKIVPKEDKEKIIL